MTDSTGFSENALKILQARYFLKNEAGDMVDKTPADLFRRVADYVATAETSEAGRKAYADRFFAAMLAGFCRATGIPSDVPFDQLDVLLIETAQDLLQAKIATIGALEAMRKAGKRLPVTVQVTLEATGTMLLGTEIGAALAALEPFDVDVIGLNCATGPREMNDAVRYLGMNSLKHVSAVPPSEVPLSAVA